MTAINLFKHSADAIDVEMGHPLFREGEVGDTMFVVLEGAVEVSHGERVIETIGPGGIIGELALIGKQEFTFLVQEHPTFALQVMTVMAERLRKANDPRPAALD